MGPGGVIYIAPRSQRGGIAVRCTAQPRVQWPCVCTAVNVVATQGCGAAQCLDPATYLALGSGRVVIPDVWAMLSGGGRHSGAGTRPASGGGVKGSIWPNLALFGGAGGRGISGGTETRAAAYLCVLPMFPRDLGGAAVPREEPRYWE